MPNYIILNFSLKRKNKIIILLPDDESSYEGRGRKI